MPTILYNMSVYLECVPLETAGTLYAPLVPQLDALLHRLLPCLAALPELDSLLAIMCSVLRIPNVNMYKVSRRVGLGDDDDFGDLKEGLLGAYQNRS